MRSGTVVTTPPAAGEFRSPDTLTDARIALVRASSYDGEAGGALDRAVQQLGALLGWGDEHAGAFGRLVRPGARVLVKPNWVLHRNQGGTGGFDALVTHGTVLAAIVRALQASDASRITIGDAPVQGCDFDKLMEASRTADWFLPAQRTDARLVGPVDFRRTVSSVDSGVRHAREAVRSLDDYVLFDLGADSYLEPVTRPDARFRVTMYPPALMSRTHAPGRHQYLVARETLEADVIVNAPKLKTHKKAGVTCALKNLVGINGNKEFLPHHRIGSPAIDGDCYPEEGVAQESVKRLLERVLDVQNSTRVTATQAALSGVARVLFSVSHRLGDTTGVEGAWSGNDTVWRMCLDLNRILLYGRLDGTIASQPQRQVVNVVDAIVAGQGDGPLAPDALPLGMLYAGASSAAVDWIGSLMLGYEPPRIPITRGAFLPGVWPLVRFDPSEIALCGDVTDVAALDQLRAGLSLRYPAGWQDAVAVR